MVKTFRSNISELENFCVKRRYLIKFTYNKQAIYIHLQLNR